MEQFIWTTIAKDCGESLNITALQALRELSINRSMSVATMRSSIRSALCAIEPYVANSRILSWKLAVVAKYMLPIFESWVICFGITPFKKKMFLPNCSILNKDRMDIYCREEIPLRGSFVQKQMLPQDPGRPILVYVYSFDETAACSTIGSYHHDLPRPEMSDNPIKNEELSRSFLLGAGNAFLHLNSDATTTKCAPDGTVVMTWNRETATNEGNEDKRTQHLLEHLRDALVPKYEGITVSKVEKIQKKKGSTFCYFTGGGGHETVHRKGRYFVYDGQ